MVFSLECFEFDCFRVLSLLISSTFKRGKIKSMKHMIFRTSARYHYELLCTYGPGRWLREDVVCFY